VVKIALDYAVFTTVMSFIHSAIPPVSVFDAYPKAQRIYAMVVFGIGIAAINWRTASQNQASVPTGKYEQVNAVPTTEQNTTTKGSL
jgi:hypothetical protein